MRKVSKLLSLLLAVLMTTSVFAIGHAESTSSELVVAGSEIPVGFDPTVYPGADYYMNMGAGEVLFKVDTDGIIQPFLAQGATQIDEHTSDLRLS